LDKIWGEKNLLNNDAFDDFHRTELMIEKCTIGGNHSLLIIKELLSKDPRRYLLDTENVTHIINKKDSHGVFPLYCASKNGNFDIVKFLLD